MSYYSENKLKCKNQQKKYREKNKTRLNNKNKAWRKKYPWKWVFSMIKQRCNNTKDSNYIRYGGKGIKCLITEEELKELWFRDKAWLLEKPSIDREDNDGHYTFDNCRFIELNKNISKDHKKSVLQFDLEGNFIREWESITKASTMLNLHNGNISSVLKNRRKSTGGFIWRYKK